MRSERELLKIMITMREFESVIKELHKEGLVEGAIHCYTGEEAIAAGVCQSLTDGDYIFSTHRGHGHAIARGCDIKAIFCELMGRAAGLSGGMGGSMHLFDVSKGLMGGNGIVAGGVTLAIGTAYASKYKGDSAVTACFFSEGASNEGWCHEAMNMAALWKLPVVFCCENNLFAATTPSFKTLSDPDLYKRAVGYGMPGVSVDGNDVIDCAKKSGDAVFRAREGSGPSFLEFKTYRVEGHCMVLDDLPVHRPKEEVDFWAERDPIKLYSEKLMNEEKLTGADIKALYDDVRREFDCAIDFAKASPRPDINHFLRRVEKRYAL